MSDLAPEFDLLRSSWPVLAATDEPSRRTLNVTAPHSGEVIAQVAVAGERQIQDALFAGFSMYRQKTRWLSGARRISILARTQELLRANADVLAREAARESGKPLRSCVAEVDQALQFVTAGLRYLRAQLSNVFPVGPLCGLQPDNDSVFVEIAEPVGLAVVVLGRTSPVQLAAQSLIAALTAGTPVIIKPAEDVPLSCLRLVHLLHEAGLPHVWCQSVVTETHDLTAQLVTDARVALFSFCGSADVGWALRSQLAPGTQAMLDHGSLVPVVVAPDADMHAAAEAVAVSGLMQNSGGGESVQRVFLLRESSSAFIKALGARAEKIVAGDPLLAQTELGSLPRSEDLGRIGRWIEEAIAGGAELVCGGYGIGRQGYAPTVLLDAALDAQVSTKTVNAPLVVVYRVDSLEEACERANALPLARSALVFTSSLPLAARLTGALDATSVSCNKPLNAVSSFFHRSSSGLRRSGQGGIGFASACSAMQIHKLIEVAL